MDEVPWRVFVPGEEGLQILREEGKELRDTGRVGEQVKHITVTRLQKCCLWDFRYVNPSNTRLGFLLHPILLLYPSKIYLNYKII